MKTVSMLTVAALLVGACANVSVKPVSVPASLQADANESLAMIVPARGVQIYECRARKEPGKGHEWVFVAPEAELFDLDGNRLGRHGAGPYWQALDGSRVMGVLRARADAPEPGNIPWLLLGATPNGQPGVFNKVSSIQRVNTVGGAAPSTPCAAESVGSQARVDYRADYYFFRAGSPVAQAKDGAARWSL